jgi:hypothetical protein
MLPDGYAVPHTETFTFCNAWLGKALKDGSPAFFQPGSHHY